MLKTNKWYIWSIEHNAWWKPNRQGYTRNKIDAGYYSLKDAKQIVENANQFCSHLVPPKESMVKV